MNKKYLFIFLPALTAFVVLAVLTLNGQAASFDTAWASRIQSIETPSMTVFLKAVSSIGEWFVYLPIAVLLLIIPKSRFKIGVPAAATLVLSAALNIVLKMLFVVPRPEVHRLIEETGYSFPSGHAMNGTAFIGICAILFLRSSFRKEYKIFAFTIATVFLILTGISRIYLGVHNPCDVLAGYAAGLCLCSAAAMVTDALKKRRTMQQPSVI